jgi:hypothetical protein
VRFGWTRRSDRVDILWGLLLRPLLVWHLSSLLALSIRNEKKKIRPQTNGFRDLPNPLALHAMLLGHLQDNARVKHKDDNCFGSAQVACITRERAHISNASLFFHRARPSQHNGAKIPAARRRARVKYSGASRSRLPPLVHDKIRSHVGCQRLRYW